MHTGRNEQGFRKIMDMTRLISIVILPVEHVCKLATSVSLLKLPSTMCNCPSSKNGEPDWIITTSYYTSHQFVSYKIFPFQVFAIAGKKSIKNNIDQLHRYNNTKSSRSMTCWRIW
jgi:hypothetical protein